MRKLAIFLATILLAINPVAAQIAAPPIQVFGSGGGGSGGVSSFNSRTGAVTLATSDIASIQGAQPFYVANYGAKCDGLTLTDVTTTAGQPTISSASVNGGTGFQQSDVGKQVTIFAGTAVTHTGTLVSGQSGITALASQTGVIVNYRITGTGVPNNTFVLDSVPSTTASMTNNATASGSPTLSFYPRINTTIISVSGGNATLATNMLASFTSNAVMTFGTDDTTAIQAADTAATAAGSGVIVLPLGTCVITASVVIDSNVSMYGQGEGASIIKWINSADQTTPMIESQTQASATPCGNVNAAATQSNNNFRYFQIDGSAAVQASFAVQAKGLGFSCSRNSTVDHVYIHDTPQTCLATDSGFPTFATNNMLVNCGRLGTSTSIGGNGIGEGLVGAPQEAYTFSNNVIINPRHYGIFVEAESSTTQCAPVTISANVIWEGGLSTSANASGPFATAAIGNSGGCGVVATGNSIFGNASVSGSLWAGISQDAGTTNLAAGTRGTYVGNYISNVITGITINYGPTIPSTGFARSVIEGNTVISSVAAGIQLVANASGSALQSVVIDGNHVTLSGSAGLLFAGGTISNAVVSGNIFCSNGSVAGTTDYRKSGIAFASNVAHLTLSGNELCDDGVATQKYGIGVNTSIAVTDALVTGNVFSGNTTNAMNLLGTIAGSFNANRGLTAPTITGTGTPTLAAGSDDWHWEATAGATATSVIVTYAYPNAHVAAPFCTVTPQTQLASFAYTITTTAVTITQPLTSGDLIDSLCQ